MPKTILLKPIITEKITNLQEEKNQYAFEVAMDANKIDIMNAIQKKFNVKIESIRTVVRKGKQRTQFTKKGRFTGFKSDRKRAIVTLNKDSKIDLFETAV
ncbi:MAG: 50S ribosomal protein L23 [Ignavibacteriae bacterium]|nr:MAG: 50S ribosomal protein L23 [Ignavibacteriota bacterium]